MIVFVLVHWQRTSSVELSRQVPFCLGFLAPLQGNAVNRIDDLWVSVCCLGDAFPPRRERSKESTQRV